MGPDKSWNVENYYGIFQPRAHSVYLRARGARRRSLGSEKPSQMKGLPPLKITDIKTILTSPNRIRLVVVKVMTSEPGLYGVGCATFTRRRLCRAYGH
ncbi:MAG: hypothetical protein WKF84_03825 [Pyrinomonadaceae bacterium]